MKKADWKKIYRSQEKSGWCGPAVIQMALLAGGIKKAQKTIAKDVYQDWWGTNHLTILTYLSQFFTKLNYKDWSNLRDIYNHLDRGHIVIVNWWDDLNPEDIDGHYSLVLGYDGRSNMLTLADPVKSRGIWKMNYDDFKKNWYDYLDTRYLIELRGWLLWIDPKSKVKI